MPILILHHGIIRPIRRPPFFLLPYCRYLHTSPEHILNKGRLPGPFSYNLRNPLNSDELGFATRHDTIQAATQMAVFHRDFLYSRRRDLRLKAHMSPEHFKQTLHNARAAIDNDKSDSLIDYIPFSKHVNATSNFFACQIVIILTRFSPLKLCRWLPLLYHHHALESDFAVRVILFLYYRVVALTLKTPKSTATPFKSPMLSLPHTTNNSLSTELYDALLHPLLEPLSSQYLSQLPLYTTVQSCPPKHLSNRVLQTWINSSHWENDLRQSQSLACQGHWLEALQHLKSSNLTPNHRFSLEYISTVHQILLAAEQSPLLPENLLTVVSLILQQEPEHHPYIWNHLIALSAKYRSSSCLEYITPRFCNDGQLHFRTRPLIGLIEACIALNLEPLDPDKYALVDREASQDCTVASLLIKAWRQFHVINQKQHDQIHTSVYSKLTPIYRRYFKIDLLTALSLPCQQSKGHQENRLPETSFALGHLLHSYMRDNMFSLELTLDLYRRFRELLAFRADLANGLKELDVAHILLIFLSAIGRTEDHSLQLSLGVVADIMKIINSIKASNKSTKKDLSTLLGHARTWITLIHALCQKGHYDAAAKVLEEIKCHAPAAYEKALFTLINGYSKTGHLHQEAMRLIDKRAAVGLNNYVKPYLTINYLKPRKQRLSLKMQYASDHPCHYIMTP